MTAQGRSPYSAPESQFSRSFPSRPSTGSPSACAGWSAGRAETVWHREAPLPVLRKPARKGGDRCPVLLSRCPAPAQAARVRRSRGRSWTRRKWVSSFPGPGRTDPLGRTDLREGVGWGGALPPAPCWHLACRPRAWGRDAQSPHWASRALARPAWPDPLWISFLTGALGRPSVTEACPGVG